MLTENLQVVRRNIKIAAEKSGRVETDILLVGVTKTIESDRVQNLVDLGVLDLGENKVQELCDKFPVINGAVNWHLIGHLQTNKVKYIIDKVSLIHSVDSLRLAEEIQKQAQKANLVMNILIEVNVAKEESKDGIFPENLLGLVSEIVKFPNICLVGLMTIAPFVENPEENREIFNKLRQMFIDISQKFTHNSNMEFLSMGMTNDYEIAIEEGANIVRVGTGLFGNRFYPKKIT